MTDRFAPLRYKIHDYQRGHLVVDGFAVRSDVPVRFCVRHTGARGWVCDDYDTGAGVSAGWGFLSREEAADVAESMLREKVESGEYQKAVKKFWKMVAK